jgi:hypothetical protein
MDANSQIAVKISEAQDVMSTARHLVEAAYMAAHGIGDSVQMNALTSLFSIVIDELHQADSMLDDVRDNMRGTSTSEGNSSRRREVQ